MSRAAYSQGTRYFWREKNTDQHFDPLPPLAKDKEEIDHLLEMQNGLGLIRVARSNQHLRIQCPFSPNTLESVDSSYKSISQIETAINELILVVLFVSSL